MKEKQVQTLNTKPRLLYPDIETPAEASGDIAKATAENCQMRHVHVK
jgi:hypothetical protein